eukprot:1056068-Alexandrium_andersonii.AAC.1
MCIRDREKDVPLTHAVGVCGALLSVCTHGSRHVQLLLCSFPMRARSGPILGALMPCHLLAGAARRDGATHCK